MAPESTPVRLVGADTRRACAVGALALLTAASACGPRAPQASGPGRVRVAYTSPVDVGDLPSLIAHRTLAARGYDVETTFFAQPELAVEALAQGDVEFANGGVRAFWAAVGKGADLVMVMEHAENGYQIAARADLRRGEDLSGRTLALSSPGALPTALGEAYLRRRAGATPLVLNMPHSGDRLAALAAGAIDAAVLQRADVARLEGRAPGRFHVLARFDEEFPDLRFEGLFVNGRFARANRSAVIDYARARIQANRRVLDDPTLLFEEARRWPAMGALDDAIVNGEVQAPAWTRDGGLRPGSAAATLAFLVSAGSLPASLHAGQLADPSFLAEALRFTSSAVEAPSAVPRQRP